MSRKSESKVEVKDPGKKQPLAILWLEGGIGAVVASTAMVETAYRMFEKLIVCTYYPDIFASDDRVAELYSFDDANLVYNTYLKFKPIPVFKNQYMHYRPSVTGRHIVPLQHQFAELPWDGTTWPSLKVNPQEELKFKDLWDPKKKRAIIHINGSTSAFNPNDKWNFNKEVLLKVWEKVVSTLSVSGYDIVQLGVTTEVAISGAKDMRGKTSIRDMMVLVSMSDVVVSIESSVAHMAGAMKKPGVVFYTSTSPKAFGYPTLLSVEPTSECRYCGRPDTFYGDMVKQNGQQVGWQCRTLECAKSITEDMALSKLTGLLNSLEK